MRNREDEVEEKAVERSVALESLHLVPRSFKEQQRLSALPAGFYVLLLSVIIMVESWFLLRMMESQFNRVSIDQYIVIEHETYRTDRPGPTEL
jgi:hypothetical protein